MTSLDQLAEQFVASSGLPNLTKAESELVRRLPRPPDIGPLSAVKPMPASSMTTSSPLADDIVRAEMVRWLCTARDARDLVDVGGLYIAGCMIRGTAHHSATYPGGVLDLCSLTLPFPLIFHKCTLPTWVLLLGANLPFVDFDGCEAGSIIADVLKVRGDVYLRNGFHAQGSIRLSGAAVGGDLDLSGAKIDHYDHGGERDKRHDRGFALNAEGIHVSGDVLLTNGSVVIGGKPQSVRFRSTGGSVCLDGAEIDGDLNIEAGELTASSAADSVVKGTALSFRAAVVKGHVALSKGFKASGAVRLPGAQIGGHLDCGRGTFSNAWRANDASSGVSIQADGARIAMDLKFNDHFRSNGTVSLVGTLVSGVFDRRDGTFNQTTRTTQAPTGMLIDRRAALDLSNARVAYANFPGDPPDTEDRVLDGFVYDHILESARESNRWSSYLKWIESDTFLPQPYIQLAQVLRQDGDRGVPGRF
jgi:hypothetical protein